MASETRHVPRPHEWLPQPGTPQRAQDAYRDLLRDFATAVDVLNAHQPMATRARDLQKCVCEHPWPCLTLTRAIAELAIATDVDQLLALERGAATSTGGVGGAAAARPTGSGFIQLTPEVFVDPADVAAVTQHQHFHDESIVWIRSAGKGGIRVRRPLADVAAHLATARAVPAPPAPGPD